MSAKDEKTQPTIHEEFKACISIPDSSHRIGDEKKRTIEFLPDDFVERMEEHLKIEIDYFEKYNNRLPNKKEQEAIIKGKIFEEVVFSEYILEKLSHLKEGTEEHDLAEDYLIIGRTLCNIARDPKKHGIHLGFNHNRIPDGVYVSMSKEGNFHIYGLSEAKMGILDERALSQLDIYGSRETMALIVERVNELSINFNNDNSFEITPEIQIIANVLKKHNSQLSVKWEEVRDKRLPKMNMELRVPKRFYGSFLPEDSKLRQRYDEISSQQGFQEVQSRFTSKDIEKMTDVVLGRIFGQLD